MVVDKEVAAAANAAVARCRGEDGHGWRGCGGCQPFSWCSGSGHGWGGWRIWKIRTEIHFLPGGREVGVSWVDGRKHKKEGQVSLPLDSGGSDGGCLRSVGGLEQPIRMQELPRARYAL